MSTDAASNLDEMLGVELSNQATPMTGVNGLQLLNIDPEVAAEAIASVFYATWLRERQALSSCMQLTSGAA